MLAENRHRRKAEVSYDADDVSSDRDCKSIVSLHCSDKQALHVITFVYKDKAAKS